MEAHCWGDPARSAGSGSEPALQAGWSWGRVGSRGGLWELEDSGGSPRRQAAGPCRPAGVRLRAQTKWALFKDSHERSLGKTVKNPIVNVLGRAPRRVPAAGGRWQTRGLHRRLRGEARGGSLDRRPLRVNVSRFFVFCFPFFP